MDCNQSEIGSGGGGSGDNGTPNQNTSNGVPGVTVVSGSASDQNNTALGDGTGGSITSSFRNTAGGEAISVVTAANIDSSPKNPTGGGVGPGEGVTPDHGASNPKNTSSGDFGPGETVGNGSSSQKHTSNGEVGPGGGVTPNNNGASNPKNTSRLSGEVPEVTVASGAPNLKNTTGGGVAPGITVGNGGSSQKNTSNGEVGAGVTPGPGIDAASQRHGASGNTNENLPASTAAVNPGRNNATALMNAFTTLAATSLATPGYNLGNFFPFGSFYGDNEAIFYDKDDGLNRYTLPQMILFGRQKTNVLWISANGYVTLNRAYIDPNPKKFPLVDSTFTMLAPFWADIDLTHGSGKVYYHFYSRDVISSQRLPSDNNIFELVRKEISSTYADSSFEATMVCVITWMDVQPAPSDKTKREHTSFQLAMASDARTSRSYVIFNYNSYSWNAWRIDSVQGYQVADGSVPANNFYTSKSVFVMTLPILPGNKGKIGQWLYLTSDPKAESSDVSAEYQCMAWYNDQLINDKVVQAQFKNMPACPSWLEKAQLDPRFYVNLTSLCGVMTFPITGTTFTQTCCYNAWDGSLSSTANYNSGTFVYNASKSYSLDQEAKKWCCLESSKCKVFHELRPVSTCKKYLAPVIGIMFGEPHIITPDGLSYIFNGWCEYWLVKNDALFHMQGRTDLAWDVAGNRVEAATVFVAYAAQHVHSPNQADNSVQEPASRIHVELTPNRKSMIIRVDATTVLTEWFERAADGESKVFSSLFISKRNESLIASFPSGIAFMLSVGGAQLEMTLQMPRNLNSAGDQFTGLYGTINKDPSDDLLTRNGSRLSANASEEEIFKHFGQSWRLNSAAESLFDYTTTKGFDAYQHADFVPSFDIPSSATADQIEEATQLCTASGVVIKSCVRDYLITGNKEVAISTRDAEKTFTERSNLLNSNEIYVEVSSQSVQWKVNQSYSLTITATNSDEKQIPKLQLNVNFTGPGWTSTGTAGLWTFTWTPPDLNPVWLSFSSNDSTGARAPPRVVTIELCNCNDRGDCQWDMLQDGYRDTDLFRVVQCACEPPGVYEGQHCESEFNSCAYNPCGESRQCTSRPAAELMALIASGKGAAGYTCSECPSGYVQMGSKCFGNETNAYNAIIDPALSTRSLADATNRAITTVMLPNTSSGTGRGATIQNGVTDGLNGESAVNGPHATSNTSVVSSPELNTGLSHKVSSMKPSGVHSTVPNAITSGNATISSSEAASTPLGLIIGVICGGLVVIVLVPALIYYFIHKNRSRKPFQMRPVEPVRKSSMLERAFEAQLRFPNPERLTWYPAFGHMSSASEYMIHDPVGGASPVGPAMEPARWEAPQAVNWSALRKFKGQYNPRFDRTAEFYNGNRL